MASILIPAIDSVLHQLASMRFNILFPVREMKVGLRSLKTLFLLFGRSATAGNLDLDEMLPEAIPLHGKLEELLTRLRSFDADANSLKKYYQDWAEKEEQILDPGDVAKALKSHLEDPITDFVRVIVVEVQRLCVVKLSNHRGGGQACGLLMADEIVGFADPILENIADFGAIASASGSLHSIQLKGEAIDAFEVQVKFMKDFLVFAMGTGSVVDHEQLQNLLIRIQPFAIYSQTVFLKHGLGGSYGNWIEEVQTRCSALSAMSIDPRVCEAYTRALRSLKPALQMSNDTTNMLNCFVDSLISLLWDILRGKDDEQSQEVMLYARLLRISRTVLKQPPQSFDGNKIGGLICDAGALICSLRRTDAADTSHPGRFPELLQRLDAFQDEHEVILEADQELCVADVTNTMEDVSLSVRTQKETASTSHQVAEFKDDELNLVLDRLRRGTSKNLQIVPISGMAGVGKTTFALALYNHVSVKYHFQARARCSVSQVLDKKKVLLQLLRQTQPGGAYSSMTPEDDLANKLRQSLKGKRYLIYLDDVWTCEVLNHLSLSFPDDYTQSRILLTSRYGDIVPHEQPHPLRFRDDDECLQILERRLLLKQGWNPEFGMKVAKLCKGLPLTAVIAAGFLATTVKEGWKGILHALTAGSVSIAQRCNTVLELSYKHLPDHLKSCLLYFGAFPEDEKVLARRLTRLWMAEGFVPEDNSKRIEDVARECLEHLIERSLVMVAQNSITGGVKTCQIHDLLHDFCRTKAKQKGFFHLLQGHEQLSNMKDTLSVQRLCIHSELIQFKKAKLFCPQAYSLMFFTSEGQVWSFTCLFDMLFILQIFKGLKVLDIENILLSSGIPSEIERLTQLRYLSAGSEVGVIPSSLGNLSNLETFTMEFPSGRIEDPVSLPESFWNLHELKYLDIRCTTRGLLPLENLQELSKLETIRGVIFLCDGSMETVMRKLTNIRRFKCVMVPVSGSMEDIDMIVVPDILKHLQSLTILARSLGIGCRFQLEFGFSVSLKKVKLQRFRLSGVEITVLGKLPNLEYLKLVGISFVEGTLEMDEGDFQKLRYLQLRDAFSSSLRSWTVFDDLPCFQKLVLENCKKLEEMPSCLESSSTLVEIELYNCPPNVENMVTDIRDQQKDCGNFVNVHIELQEDLSRGIFGG